MAGGRRRSIGRRSFLASVYRIEDLGDGSPLHQANPREASGFGAGGVVDPRGDFRIDEQAWE
jgi:hypothetical protein